MNYNKLSKIIITPKQAKPGSRDKVRGVFLTATLINKFHSQVIRNNQLIDRVTVRITADDLSRNF